MGMKGKKVFITAAGQGIGRAITERLIKEGAEVEATDLNPDTLKEIQGAKSYVLDVTDKSALQNSINKFQPDVLINCAGIVNHGTIMTSSDKEFDFAVNLNIKSMFHGIQAAIPHMIEKGGGSIVNISSVVSSVLAAPDRFIYGTTKAAVIGLTKSVARDYVSKSIRCNCICPATVDTPSLHQRLANTGNYDQALKDFTARQPMGRIAEAKEIANLALYLASDESNFTTGQAHVIDGGWSNG